jgi:hypothetical protein
MPTVKVKVAGMALSAVQMVIAQEVPLMVTKVHRLEVVEVAVRLVVVEILIKFPL